MAGTSKTFARRRQVVNHLKNGNFFNIPKEYTFIPDGNGYKLTKVFRTTHRYDRTSPFAKKEAKGFFVPTQAAEENFIGYWDVWGAEGVVGVNQSGVSLDGGNLLDIVFTAAGDIMFKQSLPNFEKFKGHPVSLAVSGYDRAGSAKVMMSLDAGSEVLDTRPFFSRYFGAYERMVQTVAVPLEATKLDFLITISGVQDDAISISGATLVMGAYLADVPYSDNIPDRSMPSGAIILFEGDVCPPGYRCIGEDVYLLATQGDPNAFRGDVTGEEDLSLCLGQNNHDHASTRVSEVEPAAFETSDDALATGPIYSLDLRETQILPIPEDHAGKRIEIFPPEHTHLIQVNEAVEPPYLKAKMCEKI